MKAEVIIGGRVSTSKGAQTGQYGGYEGEGIVSELDGKYYTLTKRGALFSACNQVAVTTSVALAGSYSGFCLSNPIGSGVDLELITASFALSVAPAAIAPIFLIGGYSSSTNVVHTTPIAAASGFQSNFLNGTSSSSAKVDSAATVVNPFYLMPIMGGFTSAALPSSSQAIIDIAGQIILPPGAWVAIGSLTSVVGFGCMAWAERTAMAGLADK